MSNTRYEHRIPRKANGCTKTPVLAPFFNEYDARDRPVVRISYLLYIAVNGAQGRSLLAADRQSFITSTNDRLMYQHFTFQEQRYTPWRQLLIERITLRHTQRTSFSWTDDITQWRRNGDKASLALTFERDRLWHSSYNLYYYHCNFFTITFRRNLGFETERLT